MKLFPETTHKKKLYHNGFFIYAHLVLMPLVFGQLTDCSTLSCTTAKNQNNFSMFFLPL